MSDIILCQKYMLIEDNMRNWIPKNNEVVTKKNKKYFKDERKIDLNKDQLFWCFFIIINGEDNYEMDHSFKKEKEFKIDCIEKLRKIKPQLRAIKLKLNEIEDELLNCEKITIKSLIALFLLYNKNLMYVWDRKYYEFINSDEKINIIIMDKNKEISYQINEEKMNFYRENYLSIKNIDKPLKSISGYTREELIIIAKKLDIAEIDKKLKKEIYERILEKI